MKTAISIPDPLFAAADELARRLGLSRSELYQRAIASYLERHDDAMVTDRLDRVYGGDDRGALDPVLVQLQRRSLPKDEW